ncbi:MAG: hypothetical protein ABI841_03275 [Chloroflexota bacterium]
MTIPRRPFAAFLVVAATGCSGSASVSTCYAYSAITQTTTVKPLAPED